MQLVIQDLLQLSCGILALPVSARAGIYGLTSAVLTRQPLANTAYQRNAKRMLGATLFTQAENSSLIIALMTTQEYVGGNRQHTNLTALAECLTCISECSKVEQLPVYLPYRICANSWCSGPTEILREALWLKVIALIAKHTPAAIVALPQL